MHQRLFTPHQFGVYMRRLRPIETSSSKWPVIRGSDVRAHLAENRLIVERGFEDVPDLRKPRLVLAECLRRLDLDVDSTESKLYKTQRGPVIAIALRGEPKWLAVFRLDAECASHYA